MNLLQPVKNQPATVLLESIKLVLLAALVLCLLSAFANAAPGNGGDFAYRTLGGTYARDQQLNPNGDSQNFDNDWSSNSERTAFQQVNGQALATHILYPFSYYRSAQARYTENGVNGDGLPISQSELPANDERRPLIVIHGWQGNTNDPVQLTRSSNSAESYWKEFLTFFELSGLDQHFRLYLYHYPTYKRITFNGRVLSNLLGQVTYIRDWVENGGRISILAHSMGGLVARSFLEQHNGIYVADDPENPTNYGRLADATGDKLLHQLITLATPHHGSPAAVKQWVDAAALLQFLKDTNTPGANDLYWDNYDGVLAYAKPDLEKSTSCVSSGNSYRVRGLNDFDVEYRVRLIGEFSYGAAATDTFDVEKNICPPEAFYRFPNPWLSWLNEQFRKEDNDALRRRYIFYAGFNDSFDNTCSEMVCVPAPNNLLNDAVLSYKPATKKVFDAGYVNDGVVPLSSAFLDFSQELTGLFDAENPSNPNLFTYDYPGDPCTGLDPSEGCLKSAREFGLLSDAGSYVSLQDGARNPSRPAYRVFKDYHHTRMHRGAIGVVPGLKGIGKGFRSDEIRVGYIEQADGAVYSPAAASSLDPYRHEPLFLSLKRDLLGRALVKRLEAGVDVSTDGLTASFSVIGLSRNFEPPRFAWDFGDGSPTVASNSPAISHTYTADGSYVVSLVVSGYDSGNYISDEIVTTVEVGSATVDTDLDGMPDDWEDLYGLDKTDPSDANGDNNNNGVLNWQEYPDDPTALCEAPCITVVGDVSGGSITPTTVEVITPVLRIRSGPSVGYSIISTVAAGQRYIATEASGQWRRIDIPTSRQANGARKAWLALEDPDTGETLAAEREPGPQAIVQNTGELGLNVRLGPSTSFDPPIAKVWDGQRFPWDATSGGWYRMALPAGYSASAGWSSDVQPDDTLLIVGLSIDADLPPGDLDGDRIDDTQDAFPNDPAASSDSDGDGYADAWNPGASEQQIASSSTELDASPFDASIWLAPAVVDSGETDLIAAEYFIDVDPGAGNGTPIYPRDGQFDSPVEAFERYSVPTAGLRTGTHTIGVRVQDELGDWSPTRFSTFVIAESVLGAGSGSVSAYGGASLDGAEFFFGADPGVGRGIPIAPRDGVFDSSVEVFDELDLSTAGLGEGVHRISVRVRKVGNIWSEPVSANFTVGSELGTYDRTTFEQLGGVFVDRAEYFFDTDPGQDNGTPLAIDRESLDSVVVTLDSPVVDTSMLSAGVHTFYLRVQDTIGVWSQPRSAKILVAWSSTEDTDLDGFVDSEDNCPLSANETQIDSDLDGTGDVCDEDDDNDGLTDETDPYPLDPINFRDADSDGIEDLVDNCSAISNPDQANFDGDSEGDECDLDDDNDRVLDADEIEIGTNPKLADSDGDGFSDGEEISAGTSPLDSASVPQIPLLNIILIKAAIDARDPN